jgi:small subunit ribosomal protein S6
MRRYETLYIVSPNLADEDYKKAITKFNSLIEKQKGILVKVQEWGRQRLAYEVKKFDKGSYVLMDYCGEPEITAELERDLKLDDRVLMFQTIKLADRVDHQELILKAKEAEEEIAEREAQIIEKETTVQNDVKEEFEEVKNGVS